MEIRYSSSFVESYSDDKLKELGDKAFTILASIFVYIVPFCYRFVLKIHSKNESELAVFTYMAKILESFGTYTAKTYSRWIEISPKEAENAKHS